MLLLPLLLSAVPATQAPHCDISTEMSAALDRGLPAGDPFVFCAPHEKPIRRVQPFDPLWLGQAGMPSFASSCHPGQFFTFQIGVLARKDIDSVAVQFSDLAGSQGTITGKLARCISLGGIDQHGNAFQKQLTIGSGRLQPLWCGWDVPKDASGTYRGTISLHLGKKTQKIPLQLNVTGDAVPDWGAEDANALTRLRWLDSTAGEGDSIPKPFVAIQRKGNSIQVLGRRMELNSKGLPAQIESHFSSANTHLVDETKQVLAGPMEFVVEQAGRVLPLRTKLKTIHSTATEATWAAIADPADLEASVAGRLDFTGSGQIKIQLHANWNVDLSDVHLDIPLAPESAKYMMGLDRKGGLRPATHEWHWNTARHQDCFWIGDVNAGLMVRLKDAHYRRPLLNIYYSFLPLVMPDSWGNGGKGGVRVFEQDGKVFARIFTGPMTMTKDQTLDFTADLYLTPFRPIDTEKQWATRFVHPHPSRDPLPLDDAVAHADAKAGLNVVTVHQATYYNPYINYPYSPDSFEAFSDLVKRAHEKGVRARVYYTTREITQNMPELYALHSLNGEVVFPGPGREAKTLINPKGPNPWLVENLGSDFVPAWVDHVGGKYAEDDISVITTPDSRWNNFYLEGLKWMIDRAKIDGVYIDDTALDASSLLRARRILSARPDPLIDLHTWNHFNEYAGFANNLNLYMEVLPYLDRLWLGEGFSADEAPWDYWLVEMSGLPFGSMSEMLESPNPARGLVFGETGRLGWAGDPRPEWKLFDEFGIQGTEMIPFSSPECPVQTGDPDVKATVYKGQGHSIIALASWADHPGTVQLKIDWKALGLDPKTVKGSRPAVEGIQDAGTWEEGDSFAVNPGHGAVIVLKSYF